MHTGIYTHVLDLTKKMKCIIPLVISIALRLLYQEHKWRICDIARKYPQFARRSISRHVKKPISANDNAVFDRCRYNSGRPRKVTERDQKKS